MNKNAAIATIWLAMICAPVYAQQEVKISVSYFDSNAVVLEVNSALHATYGLSYPLTHKITFMSGVEDLMVESRYGSTAPWTALPERTAQDFFNGIAAVRFDYSIQIAYVSIAFSESSDSLYLRIRNGSGETEVIEYNGICRYYDNRRAAVTCTADDWHPSFDPYFSETLPQYRSRNLWVTAAIVTEWCDAQTWGNIQAQLDSGFVEAASHGRNHLYVPYENAVSEVTGARDDIIQNLRLPVSFSNGSREYVYVWIAPYGQYDDEIDSLVSLNRYLVSRLYESGYSDFATWQAERNFFGAINITQEMGPLWGGITDLTVLNSTFDSVVADSGVYHLVCHPHVLHNYGAWDMDYTHQHLDHISNRTDLWYVSLGHLYLYRLLQDDTAAPKLAIAGRENTPRSVALGNYPNPFNPNTTIRFNLVNSSPVVLTIYDLLGNEIVRLLDKNAVAGDYAVFWDGLDLTGRRVPTGLYIARLATPKYAKSIKMVLLK